MMKPIELQKKVDIDDIFIRYSFGKMFKSFNNFFYSLKKAKHFKEEQHDLMILLLLLLRYLSVERSRPFENNCFREYLKLSVFDGEKRTANTFIRSL